MILIWLILLAGIAGAMLVWGFWRTDRFLQYPTLAGAAYFCYVLPQAVGLSCNPERLPTAVWRDGGPQLAVLMACCCALAGCIGYHISPQKQSAIGKWFNGRCDRKALLLGAFVLLITGLFAWYKLTRLSGGFIAHYSVGGNYGLSWRGLSVRYTFFSKLAGLAGILFLVLALEKPSRTRWAIVFVANIPTLAAIVFLGRRSSTVQLALTVALCLYFLKGWRPPRWLATAAIIVGSVFIFSWGTVRDYTQIGADHSEILNHDYMEDVASVVSGEAYSEFEVAAIRAAQVNQSFDLGWGTGFYNAIISCWVPRQIVGEDFKRRLQLHLEKDYPRYSWDIPYGSNPTGIANAFAEFWFFGAIFYLLLGMGFRRLWYWANLGGVRAQIAYIVLAPLALSSVVGNLVLLPSELLYYVVFLGPVLVFAGRTRFHQSKRRVN